MAERAQYAPVARAPRNLEAEVGGGVAQLAERLARAGDAYSRRLDALDKRLDQAMAEEKISLKGYWARSFFERLTDEEAARFMIRAAAEAGGLRATAESWQQYRRNAEARTETEIVIAATRFGPTSTSPGSWSSATGNT